jgi:hypothetical protein
MPDDARIPDVQPLARLVRRGLDRTPHWSRRAGFKFTAARRMNLFGAGAVKAA